MQHQQQNKVVQQDEGDTREGFGLSQQTSPAQQPKWLFLKNNEFPLSLFIEKKNKTNAWDWEAAWAVFCHHAFHKDPPWHQDRVPESQLGTANDAAMSGILSVSWLT